MLLCLWPVGTPRYGGLNLNGSDRFQMPLRTNAGRQVRGPVAVQGIEKNLNPVPPLPWSRTQSGSDWVMTLPTKRYYVSNGTGNASRQRKFSGALGSCDDLTLNLLDREERRIAHPPIDSEHPGKSPPMLCWEANVVTFNNSNVLGSLNAVNASTSDVFF